MNTYISAHAKNRMQQRAINPNVLELLDIYGIEHYQQGGTVLQFIDQKSAAKALRAIRKDLDKLITSNSVSKVFDLGKDLLITTFHENGKQKKR